MFVYFLGTIKDDCGKAIYAVEDTVGNVEKIVRDDIITDEDDADNIINVSWLCYDLRINCLGHYDL